VATLAGVGENTILSSRSPSRSVTIGRQQECVGAQVLYSYVDGVYYYQRQRISSNLIHLEGDLSKPDENGRQNVFTSLSVYIQHSLFLCLTLNDTLMTTSSGKIEV
jgi:hypothetical protein